MFKFTFPGTVISVTVHFLWSVGPPEDNSERMSPSDATVSSGEEDVVVSPQHVHHLPSLPHLWE